jgi:DNA primase
MAGFGARILRPDDIPKFLNSPQTVLFDKGRLLYGLDRARKAIRDADQVVIVEGYLDVIALHQGGFANAVSPMGTALSDYQLAVLKRYTHRIVLALDPDAAGDKATLRGLDIARQALDRESDPVFDARGLLGFEARLQADIRVTTLPDGMDPDDVVNRDPQEWEQILENARPVVIHVMETLAQGKDLDDPKTKEEIAGRVLPLIQDVPSPIERDTYRQRLARLLRIDEHTLLESAPRPSRRRQRPARPQPSPAAQPLSISSVKSSNYLLEAHCLGVLLRRPDLLYNLDRKLQQVHQGRISPNDFQHADHQSILRVLLESVDQDLSEPFQFAVSNLSLSMLEYADGMLARTEKVNPQDDDVLEDLMRAVLTLRRRNEQQSIDYLRYLMQESQEAGDIKATHYRETMVQHTHRLKELDQALGQFTSRSTIQK